MCRSKDDLSFHVRWCCSRRLVKVRNANFLLYFLLTGEQRFIAVKTISEIAWFHFLVLDRKKKSKCLTSLLVTLSSSWDYTGWWNQHNSHSGILSVVFQRMETLRVETKINRVNVYIYFTSLKVGFDAKLCSVGVGNNRLLVGNRIWWLLTKSKQHMWKHGWDSKCLEVLNLWIYICWPHLLPW